MDHYLYRQPVAFGTGYLPIVPSALSVTFRPIFR